MCPAHTRGHLSNNPPAYRGAETQVRMSKGPSRGHTGQPPQTGTHTSRFVPPPHLGGQVMWHQKSTCCLGGPPRYPVQPGVHATGRGQFASLSGRQLRTGHKRELMQCLRGPLSTHSQGGDGCFGEDRQHLEMLCGKTEALWGRGPLVLEKHLDGVTTQGCQDTRCVRRDPGALSCRGHQLDMTGSPPKMPQDGPGTGQQSHQLPPTLCQPQTILEAGRARGRGWEHRPGCSQSGPGHKDSSRPHSQAACRGLEPCLPDPHGILHTLHHPPAPRLQWDA